MVGVAALLGDRPVHFVLEVEVQVGEQIAKQRVGRQAIGQRFGNPRRGHGAGLAQAFTHRVRQPGPPFGGQMQQHLLMRGEVTAYRGIVHAGATGNVSQGHRRNTGFQCQRAGGLNQRRCALALLVFGAGTLEGELRHRARITHLD